MSRQTKCRGFTLIELLIVVAIIAILALIAVPNFLEAQVRAKVSRVKADMRTVATAMEAYRVDWNCVPYWDWADDLPRTYEGWSGPGHVWWALTTPVVYLTSALRDPFVLAPLWSLADHGSGAKSALHPFINVATGYLGPPSESAPRTHWIALSPGPDFQDNTYVHAYYPYSEEACPYDPTNGTVSAGDIYHFDGRPPTNFLSDLNWGGPTGQGNFDPWW